MTTDTEELLADAADDSAMPLLRPISDVVRRGRRRARIRQAGVLAATVVTTSTVAAGIAVWSGGGGTGTQLQPAAGPTSVQVNPSTGQVTPIKPVAQPPASPLSDAQIISRCRILDRQFTRGSNKAGSGTQPIDDWSVKVTQGQGTWFRAMLLSPDGKRYAYCQDNGGPGAPYDDYNREAVTLIKDFEVWADRDGSRGRVPAKVARLTFQVQGGPVSTAVIRDRFFLWTADLPHAQVKGKPIWAVFYDAKGRELARFDANPFNPEATPPPCVAESETCEATPVTKRTPILPR